MQWCAGRGEVHSSLAVCHIGLTIHQLKDESPHEPFRLMGYLSVSLLVGCEMHLVLGSV